MYSRIKFRIPEFTDKGNFSSFQYLELGDWIECTLAGSNGQPQQCTGKVDKNNKLIYEGDICKTRTLTGKVKWNSAECCFMFHYGRLVGDWVLLTFNPDEIEIIGNIYENTSLAEGISRQ